ncbi:MAG TPA: MAPEG family protein [Wenzhouxiangellaceae bacterium]|nr:MAPEG family protein [Wenzhouxiangellaceae bacterium]
MYSSVVLLYTSLLALLLIGLSYNVVRLRQQYQVGIGTGSVQALERAVRAQANFCEYVPLALLLLALIEFGTNMPAWALHILGLLLFVGRVMHALGLNRTAGASSARVVGIVLTWIVLLVASGMGLAAWVVAALN